MLKSEDLSEADRDYQSWACSVEALETCFVQGVEGGLLLDDKDPNNSAQRRYAFTDGLDTTLANVWGGEETFRTRCLIDCQIRRVVLEESLRLTTCRSRLETRQV